MDNKILKKEVNKPLLTVLNYSGGVQSSCLLWMIILGDLPKPSNFIVVNADPGMENSETYAYNNKMQHTCKENGIEYYKAVGPNLLHDLLNIHSSPSKRLDNPPYWTVGKKGKRGRLKQKCTQIYKIRPMNRLIREILFNKYNISKKSSRLGENIVQKWIGFTADEKHRVTSSKQKYIEFSFPLIEMGLTRSDVLLYFKSKNLTVPPRSLCNGCFAHGLSSLKEMYEKRPADWQQAVDIDNTIRDLSKIMVEKPCFVSHTLVPLEELAKRNFDLGDKIQNDLHSCNSGVCFV